jgi:hypothetical protein
MLPGACALHAPAAASIALMQVLSTSVCACAAYGSYALQCTAINAGFNSVACTAMCVAWSLTVCAVPYSSIGM